jgi:hypothetical protein
MQKDERNLLEVLKEELDFVEDGGYAQSAKTQWRPRYIFEDSPSCANYNAREKREACSACVLMQLVPKEFRETHIPCRHIPLTAKGETLDSMYRYDDSLTIEETLNGWLRRTIAELERQRATEAKTQRSVPASGGNSPNASPLYQSMHPKCANPSCATEFRWTAGGKFFRFHIERAPAQSAGEYGAVSPAGTHEVRHYWLCEKCCQPYTLSSEEPSKVVVKPLWPEISAVESHKNLTVTAQPRRNTGQE